MRTVIMSHHKFNALTVVAARTKLPLLDLR